MPGDRGWPRQRADLPDPGARRHARRASVRRARSGDRRMMTVDLIIVGGGPAGVTAAIEGRSRGLSVLLLDENASPGGRIWQALETRGAKDEDDAAALRTLQSFRACGADARWRSSVWAIDPDGTVYWSDDRSTQSARGEYVLLATGTTERPMPIPGWTLPGVMTVGAAQIAFKTSG